ncbi:hypothetical protein BCR36DRAFT_415173 [Piromyces finnis]|uniref:Uncharacterized protein n=1 Tax=Piromyces finnis TaxID=1754191 RepID=A0A1Y1UZU5_9FUNG|nr:hypothetical protein BCR36DRAFT_415173 [Piromyces finnis]|eukprot:ORX44135.1 hypothetical protein BCR36DRAFT_415173 [Piromyces finnis]
MISQDNDYVQTFIYGLIWASICFLLYKGAKENNENGVNKENKKNNENIKTNKLIIPEKYQIIGYPLLSFLFSASVFLTLKLISQETGYNYQKLIPSISLILLLQCISLVFFWITIFNKKNQISYLVSFILFITALFLYFAVINLNENNIEDENIKFKKLSKKPTISSGLSVILSFYFCCISMINTISENKKGFLSYFGEALLKALNVKNPNIECQTKEVKKKN